MPIRFCNLDKRSFGGVTDRQTLIGLDLRKNGRRKFIGVLLQKRVDKWLVAEGREKLMEVFWFYFKME